MATKTYLIYLFSTSWVPQETKRNVDSKHLGIYDRNKKQILTIFFLFSN